MPAACCPATTRSRSRSSTGSPSSASSAWPRRARPRWRSGSTSTSTSTWGTCSGRPPLGDRPGRKKRPRVVVLGGGVAGMTAAMELSRPGWEQRYESITLYQYGWRLGGKGASGRGVNERIEEHGLHIWLGFYDNAFRLLRDCYDELGRAPDTVPIPSIETAFERASLFIVQEPRGQEWVPWMAQFPETGETPGVNPTEPPSLWELMLRALRLALVYDEDARRTPANAEAEPDLALVPVGDPAESPDLALVPVAGGSSRSLAEQAWDLYAKAARVVSDL